MSGEAMAERLNTMPAGGRALLTNGLFFDEFLYAFSPTSRYQPHNLPPILGSTLPHLTPDHEALWDELKPIIAARPPAPVAEQYRFLFEWLRERFSRETWVERSGGSLALAGRLAEVFPDARFVHIHRDGRDTAISMSKHPYFILRTKVAESLRKLGMNPFSPFNTPGISPWLPTFEDLYFPFFNKRRFERIQMPLSAFGRFWSGMVENGLRALGKLEKERVLTISYEELVTSPREEIERFMAFLGSEFHDVSWLNAVAEWPKQRPPNWQRLDPEAREQLAKACQPAQTMLANSR